MKGFDGRKRKNIQNINYSQEKGNSYAISKPTKAKNKHRNIRNKIYFQEKAEVYLRLTISSMTEIYKIRLNRRSSFFSFAYSKFARSGRFYFKSTGV